MKNIKIIKYRVFCIDRTLWPNLVDFFNEYLPGSEFINQDIIVYNGSVYNVVKCEGVGIHIQRDLQFYILKKIKPVQ